MAGKVLNIRVKYCGGCNPEIDRVAVVRLLEELASRCGFTVSLTDDGPTDVVLLVNGCAKACLEEDYPEALSLTCALSVQGARLDYRPVPEKDLPALLWQRIRHSCLKPVEP